MIFSLMRLWIWLSIIRCLIISIFFIWPSCPSEPLELTPAQVRSPVSLASQAQTRTINLTRPVGYGIFPSYWIFSRKIFFAWKFFQNFSVFAALMPCFLWFFVRFWPNFPVFYENIGICVRFFTICSLWYEQIFCSNSYEFSRKCAKIVRFFANFSWKIA